jgi:hypothetical protein
VTEGRVRAATLVSIPAFQETSVGFELLPDDEPAEGEAAAEVETLAGEAARETAALVASVSAPVGPAVATFDRPVLTEPTPITFDWDAGRVFGHIALFQTCHVGYSDVCVTPPKDPTGNYAWFNRFAVDTADGDVIWAGRLTVGGRHASLSLNASQAMAAYDSKVVAAHVRAYTDEFGIVVSGPIELADDAPERAALDRRKVSGDWRETPEGLSLVEVLALSPGPRAHAEPGFPVGTFSRAGRQVALTAAFGPGAFTARSASIDVAGAVRAALIEDRRAQAARAELDEALKFHTATERAALAELMGA